MARIFQTNITMAQLAIKGHATRGSEVIALLVMLGGNNANNCYGKYYDRVYYINENGYIDQDFISHIEQNTKFIIYALEQFEEKFPYKVGDKVSSKYLKNRKIEKKEWEGINNRVIYKLQGMGWYSVNELQPYKEETMEETETISPITEINLNHPEFKGYNEIELIIPYDWKFEQRGNKMFAIRKQYPKTYEECCEVLDILENINIEGYKKELLLSLQQLLICRDAYWKIAGDWKPNWLNTNSNKYCIYYVGDEIKKQPMLEVHHFLAFPTEEIRDIFYENFKELIEECKELL